MIIEERQSTHVYRQKRLFTKEELEAREVLCVHEQPAYCNAACPLKLDTKAMVTAIAAGDFNKAMQLYDKITPLPHVLSAGCEAPCEGKCKLCFLGDGIAIRELEAAVAAYGEPPRKKAFMRKKTKKAAVFGVDLFSLFLAGELAKKMYPVTVYCQYPDREALLADIAPGAAEDLKRLDIQFEWNADPESAYAGTAMKYDLRCAAYETAQKLYPGLVVDEAVMVCREHKLITGKTEGVLGAAFGAKKAALSADRMAQNLDPSNTRGDEGAVETCHMTTHDDPVYYVDGILHYCVPNIPSLYANSSSILLSSATLPFAMQIANKGVKQALKDNKHLRNALTFWYGQVTWKETADMHGYEYVSPDSIIENFC